MPDDTTAKDRKARLEYEREYRRKNREKLLAYKAQWKSANKEKLAQQAKYYNERNKERIAEQKREYWLANKERLTARNKEYVAANKDVGNKACRKWRAANREKQKLATYEWRAANRGAYNAYCANVRNVRALRVPAWLTEEHHWMIKETYELAALREHMTSIKWHVDHIVPLQGKQVSGLHVPWNLQVIPAIENIRKKNKFEVENA